MTPREEIEKIISDLCGDKSPAALENAGILRRIISTHELVPIDNTPFDPERCGWKLVCMIPVGYHKDRDGRLHYSIIQQEEDGKMKIESMDGEEWVCPWPANHSDGVRLLQLLGLEIKE